MRNQSTLENAKMNYTQESFRKLVSQKNINLSFFSFCKEYIKKRSFSYPSPRYLFDSFGSFGLKGFFLFPAIASLLKPLRLDFRSNQFENKLGEGKFLFDHLWKRAKFLLQHHHHYYHHHHQHHNEIQKTTIESRQNCFRNHQHHFDIIKYSCLHIFFSLRSYNNNDSDNNKHRQQQTIVNINRNHYYHRHCCVVGLSRLKSTLAFWMIFIKKK